MSVYDNFNEEWTMAQIHLETNRKQENLIHGGSMNTPIKILVAIYPTYKLSENRGMTTSSSSLMPV